MRHSRWRGEFVIIACAAGRGVGTLKGNQDSVMRLNIAAVLLVWLLPCGVGAQMAPYDRSLALRTAFTASDSGDHARSVALLRAMIDRDKSERRNLLRALADQIYATNKPAEAVPLYREMLKWTDLPADERRGTRIILAQALVSAGLLGEALVEARGVAEEAPSDIPGRLAYARIASWSDKLRLAQAQYNAVLLLDSTNADARRGKAQISSWLGRHREAQRAFRAALIRAPADAETQYLLAESLAWMGRPDLALGILDTLAIKRPDFTPGMALRSRLVTLSRPAATLEGGFASQSDGIHMLSLALVQNLQVERGRGLGSFTVRQERDKASDGRPVQSTRPQISAQYRVNDDLQLRAGAGLVGVRSDSTSSNLLTYEAQANLWAGDVAHFDVGVDRLTIDLPQPLTRGITLTELAGGAEWLPTAYSRVAARGSVAQLSDDNQRRTTQLDAEQRIWDKPVLWLGVRRVDQLFSTDPQHGYFSPGHYSSMAAVARTWSEFSTKAFWALDLVAGREAVGGQPSRNMWAASGFVEYVPTLRVSVRPRLEYFNSTALASATLPSGSRFDRFAGTITARINW